MAITGFTRLSVRDGLCHVPVVAFLAVVAVAARCVVTTVQTHSSTLAARQFEELHVKTATPGVKVAIASYTLVGFPGRGPLPGSVVVEKFASVTFRAGGVVLTVTNQVAIPVSDTPGRVPVTLTAASDLQVGHGVIIGLPGKFRIVFVLVPEGVEAAESHLDVGSGDPVLEDRAVVKIVRRRAAVQGAESYEASSERVHVGVGVGADSLLLVLLGDGSLVGLVVHFSALGRVELERHPRFAVVHRLVDSHRFGSRGAELETDICDFEFLAEGEGEGDVLWVLDVVLRLPASQVVRVVQVSQVGRRASFLRVG